MSGAFGICLKARETPPPGEATSEAVEETGKGDQAGRIGAITMKDDAPCIVCVPMLALVTLTQSGASQKSV